MDVNEKETERAEASRVFATIDRGGAISFDAVKFFQSSEGIKFLSDAKLALKPETTDETKAAS